MVIQLITVSIKPEQRERWLELIAKNAAETRGEKGCEGVALGEDLETPNRFVIVEHWASLEAKYENFRTPKFSRLLGELDEILAGPPEVSLNEVASTQTLEEALHAAGLSE